MKYEAIVIPDELIRSARAGDGAALDALWGLCAPIHRAAARWARARPRTLDPDDLAQQAALLFLEQLRADSDPDGAAFAARYARALRTSLSSYLRAERRRLGRQQPVDEVVLDRALRRRSPGESSARGPGLQLERALARLSPRQRAVVAGLYDRDLTVARLAAELKVTPQAVTSLHRRALACLRDYLSEEPAAATDE